MLVNYYCSGNCLRPGSITCCNSIAFVYSNEEWVFFLYLFFIWKVAILVRIVTGNVYSFLS